ncbi:MAG TPA: glycosyltransferase [Patescibacteria group bacterium]|jgi:glycosyltransferase involved in cell wall biosynthesis
MRIALFASNRTTVPPDPSMVAASAALTGELADGLAERSHEVTLFAPEGSTSKAEVRDLGLPPSDFDFSLTHQEWDSKDSMGEKTMYLTELYKRADEFDVIHLHTEPVYLGMPLASLSRTPTVITVHNAFRSEQKRILDYFRKQPLVTISDYQRKLFPDLNYAATVYNGMRFDGFPDSAGNGSEKLVFAGRLVEQKGVAEAIQAAKGTGRSLRVSGVGREEFIEKEITPHVSKKIEFAGALDLGSERWVRQYADAKAALLPIQWEEPFGLTFIESMAAGTPVITFARGAAPEIIEDGKTGFLVNPSDADIRGDWQVKATGIQGLQEAIERVYSLPGEEYRTIRESAHAKVRERFSMERMIDGYENVYRKLA